MLVTLATFGSFLSPDAALHAAGAARAGGVMMSKVERNPNLGKLQGGALSARAPCCLERRARRLPTARAPC